MASGYSDLSEIRKNGRAYGGYPKPPKIDLLNEQPRRESLVEQQLETNIIRPPVIYHQVQQQFINNQLQDQHAHGSQDFYIPSPPRRYTERSTIEKMSYNAPSVTTTSMNSEFMARPSNIETYSRMESPNLRRVVTTTVNTSTTRNSNDRPQPMISVEDYSNMVHDLAQKEAKLKKEIAYLNQYSSPWSRPKQVREPRREPAPRSPRSEQRWVREVPSSPTSRSNSRASSTRSTTEADLIEKANKLLKDVEEMEKKPLKTQQILIESGATIPRPTNAADERSTVSSVHTAIIKVPNHEINNKSPLPFSYDNFSTLGVRGNIASVGAAEPDKPYAPIFPTIKRTPSPTFKR